MEKFIIEVHDGISPTQAFYYCLKVSQQGRISKTNKQPHHCFITTFANGVHVAVTRNKSGSERFRVHKP